MYTQFEKTRDRFSPQLKTKQNAWFESGELDGKYKIIVIEIFPLDLTLATKAILADRIFYFPI